MSSKYKLEFTLKQHTPIIHFQSDQPGATLRSTELKPKLDNFIRDDLKDIDRTLYEKYKNLITNEYYFPSDKGSSVYKIHISASKIKEIEYKTYIKKENISDTRQIGSYFGDLKAIQNSSIKITIKSLIPNMNELISEALKHVLIYENFGTRQTKGFGSFSLDIDQEQYEKILKKKHPIFYKRTSNEPLKTINNDYQILKSGRNKPYTKSKLFEYMCNNKIRWEKKMIKTRMQENFPAVYKELKYEHPPVTCNKNDRTYQYQYIRALLGTAEQNEYLKRDDNHSKDKIYIEIISLDNVQRYKSPITYKVFNNTIYVLPNPSKTIEGKRFDFRIKGQRQNLNDTPVTVPLDFNLVDFLDSTLTKDFGYQRIEA